jgi:hypothetical protein
MQKINSLHVMSLKPLFSMIVAFVALFCQPLLKAQSYWGDANLNTINSGSSVIFNNGGNFGGWSTPSITNISSSVLTNDHFVENVRQAIPVRFEADWYIQEMTWGTRPDYVFRNLTPTGEFQYLGTYSDAGDGGVLLEMPTNLVYQFCFNGTLTFEVFSD